jgi:hypothetical protein
VFDLLGILGFSDWEFASVVRVSGQDTCQRGVKALHENRQACLALFEYNFGDKWLIHHQPHALVLDSSILSHRLVHLPTLESRQQDRQ